MTNEKTNLSSVDLPRDEQSEERDPDKMELKKSIGSRIRQVRKSIGLTQAEMVAHFECGRANYSRIEKGEVFPNPAILRILNERFKVSLHWLICEKGDMLEDQASKGPASGMDIPAGDEEDVQDMLAYMEAVPMVRHAILGFFLEYKAKNREIIEPLVAELRQAGAQ